MKKLKIRGLKHNCFKVYPTLFQREFLPLAFSTTALSRVNITGATKNDANPPINVSITKRIPNLLGLLTKSKALFAYLRYC